MHGVLARDAGDLEVGVALDADAQGLVDEDPGVEDGEGVHVEDVDELRQIDGRLRRRGRLRELQPREGRLRRPVLEEHDALEGVDHRVDAVVGPQRAVDGHGEVLGLRLREDDALDGQAGAVDTLLGDPWDGDEDSAVRESEVCSTGPPPMPDFGCECFVLSRPLCRSIWTAQ